LSRNKDRLGMGDTTPEAASPPVAAYDSNVFSFVVPTEFVKLPSEGKHYSSEHPLFNETTIEIKQMTAKEEDILTSVTLLQNGVALERLLESIIINKAINPKTLLVGDRNAIVIAARVSGYGNMYNTAITCPACITEQKHNFDLNQAAVVTATDISKTLSKAIEILDNGNYAVVLPKSQLRVEMRLLTGRDEQILTGQLQQNKKQNSEKLVTTQLVHMICSVNGNSTKEAIDYVSHNIPSADAAFLRKIYKTIVPNVELSLDFNCAHCSHSEQMEVPLSADFFWPER
jgi:hypothetical protein